MPRLVCRLDSVPYGLLSGFICFVLKPGHNISVFLGHAKGQDDYSLFKGASTSTVPTVSEEYAIGMHAAVNTYMYIPVPRSIYPYQEGAGKHVHSSLSVYVLRAHFPDIRLLRPHLILKILKLKRRQTAN